MRVLAVVLATHVVLVASVAQARKYDAEHPWFAEGSIGTVQPGPDGTDFGAGQHYAAHVGAMTRTWSDVSLSLSYSTARKDSEALEASIVSGGLRGRSWIGVHPLSGYGEVGLRLYRSTFKERNVIAPSSESRFRAGAEFGAGVLYARSTWWAGLGAEVHTILGSAGLDNNSVLTYTTYNFFVGAPMGW